jgi:hypothetical protein
MGEKSRGKARKENSRNVHLKQSSEMRRVQTPNNRGLKLIPGQLSGEREDVQGDAQHGGFPYELRSGP